ncbi:MAG: hypothetical protein GYA51_08230 [Candidatus Methanofastidiosa archaeon]|jgi:hypothetical protein|nr:hypothetical protein [Candidatus Methanofastidiosa archaeon]
MKRILPFFVLFLIALSSFSICSSEDFLLHEFGQGYFVSDVLYDPSIDSFYLVGTINESNNSFIVKSKNGQVLRQETIEGFKVSKMQIDKFSNIYFLGTSEDNNISVIKLNSNLNERWETRIKVSERDIISSFIVNDKQEVSVLGYSSGKKESDTFIIKIDADGKIIIRNIINVGPFERPREIIEDKNNNIYITGEMKEKDLDVFLLKLSSEHELLWIDYFDNSGWEDGGLDLDLIDEDILLTAYSGKEGWYVFDTVFLKYYPDGNVSNVVRISYSGGSDWVRQLSRKEENYYAILWDILTGKEYVMKLDYYFDIITKKEIPHEEVPIKIINISNNTYLVVQKENTVYLKNLD